MAAIWGWLQEAWIVRAIEGIVAGGVGGTVVAFLRGFFGESGRQRAIERNFENLKQQLRQNTELIKEIENRFLMEDWFEKGEFEYRCRQIAELYGPLYGYLKTNKDLYELWMAGKMHPVNWQIKQLLADQNKMIIDLVRSKVHLLDEGEMPPCLIRLITSALVWNLYCPVSPEGGIPPELSQDERVKFPAEAVQYIFQKTEEIKRKRDDLYRTFEFRLSTIRSLERPAKEELAGERLDR
jgi:hypothetical protein